jgi:hypothetical protein
MTKNLIFIGEYDTKLVEAGERNLLKKRAASTTSSTTTGSSSGTAGSGSSLGSEGSTNGLVENGLKTLLGQCGALHHLVTANFLAEGESGFVSDRGLFLGSKLLDGGTVFTQIDFGSDQDEGDVGAVVRDLGIPLGPQVFKRRRVDDGIGQQENVGLRIREGSKTIIIFLSSSIPETQIDGLAVDYNVGRVTK